MNEELRKTAGLNKMKNEKWRINNYFKRKNYSLFIINYKFKHAVAFTLAEVLITLGVIGVVAAMTIPLLIANYNKKLTETRLKKFVSIYSQAVTNSIQENVDIFGDDILAAGGKNPDEMLIWYNKYLNPYIKSIKIEKTNVGIIVYLADGSAFAIAKNGADLTGLNDTHLIFCVKAKYCEELPKDDAAYYNLSDGKNKFLFYPMQSGTMDTFIQSFIVAHDQNGNAVPLELTRENALSGCEYLARNCTRLLYMDNWEIKDDYPRW